MSLENALKLHQECPVSLELFDQLRKGTDLIQLEGSAVAAKPWFLAALMKDFTPRSLLVVTYNQEQADRLAEDLPHYGISSEHIGFYPGNESAVFEDAKPEFRISGERLNTLYSLLNNKPQITIAPINALLSRTLPPGLLRQSVITLTVGQMQDIDAVTARLTDLGYESADVVDGRGEFARRGGLLDIYPTNHDNPVRVEWFGDEIESIRHFDTATQRSIDRVSETVILPSREIILDEESTKAACIRIRKEYQAQFSSLKDSGDLQSAERLQEKVEADLVRLDNRVYFNDVEFYSPYFYPAEFSLIDYLPSDTIIILDEPAQIRSHWEQMEDQILERTINRAGRGQSLASQKHRYAGIEHSMKQALDNRQGILFTLLPRSVTWATPSVRLEIKSSPMDNYSGRIVALMDQVKTWKDNGQTVIFAGVQDSRMIEILSEYDIQAARLEETVFLQSGVYVAHAPIRSGCKLASADSIIIADADVFGEQRLHRPRKTMHEGVPITSVMDLKEGDFVVHVSHGIGVYKGIKTMKNQGVEREYLLLEYAGSDLLYVPTDQIDRVQKYIGGEGNAPSVHRLGGTEWARTTKKVSKAVEQVARELVELYAWREAVPGHAYSEDTPWQQEMESAFPYEETPDQLSAIKDVKVDLQKPKVMDRLICGDVGYGKTEVAIRAAFKVAADGKQVAVLCPTTVLAQQHFSTFSERLAAFPVQIGLLSRFRSKKEQAETAQGARDGTVDIVIGTHRLLGKDVAFKEIGLLIIDEEQRFGVRHKEKLKQLRKNIDVLTMTATPIPRTLHMSLAGIRDMSVINNPPEGRIPIKTFVEEARTDVIRDAIVRELDRGGQVFFVHNRVENIGQVASQLQKLVPYARLDIGHGQMPDTELERVMMDFYEQKFDVLVCSTIVESGLDIPNVNTIIINDSDRMGLAQLYQLRGRVGRSDRQAYAYLLYKPDKVLSEVSEKRLAAIREFTDLGSGFRIAMRDLEIRGAGNLLGTQQSGNVAAVGFDLYCQLLARAVSELKGEAVEEIVLPQVDLPVDAFIPQDYISNEAHRILFYKKLAGAKTTEDLQAVQDEMEDRFGDPPRSVWNMLAVIRLRIRCHQMGIRSIGRATGQIVIVFGSERLPNSVCRELMRTYRRHFFQPERVTMTVSGHRVISEVEDMVEVLIRAFKRPKD